MLPLKITAEDYCILMEIQELEVPSEEINSNILIVFFLTNLETEALKVLAQHH